jgi:hypothetical protein
MNTVQGRRYRHQMDKEHPEMTRGNSYVTNRMMRRKKAGKE